MVKIKQDAHIRWTLRRDLLQILDIERASFTQPWTEDDFLQILRQHCIISMVAEVHDRVVGYMVYELGQKKLYLHNIAVATKGVGIGRQLIDKLKTKLSPYKRKTLECHVRETNLESQKFFRAVGMRALRVVRAFYDGEDGQAEDAYLFQYRVQSREFRNG